MPNRALKDAIDAALALAGEVAVPAPLPSPAPAPQAAVAQAPAPAEMDLLSAEKIINILDGDSQEKKGAPNDDGWVDVAAPSVAPPGTGEDSVEPVTPPSAALDAPAIEMTMQPEPEPEPELEPEPEPRCCGNCGRPHADETEQRNCEYFGRAAAKR